MRPGGKLCRSIRQRRRPRGQCTVEHVAAALGQTGPAVTRRHYLAAGNEQDGKAARCAARHHRRSPVIGWERLVDRFELTRMDVVVERGNESELVRHDATHR